MHGHWKTIGILAAIFIIKIAFANMPSEKQSPEEGEICDPIEDRLHSVSGDNTAFLICELEQKIFQLHRCDSSDGTPRIFDAKRQQCVKAGEEQHWLLMSAPNQAWKKVGDSCIVNRECWDGMYCAAGICTCYLNYVQVNSMCVRVSSTCPASTFYPEPINGKPKICSTLDPCPPGYVCRPEPGGDQGICCLATESEVCGASNAHIINGRPVSCYDTSMAESCPDGYACQFYPSANRRYCCQLENSSAKSTESFTTPSVTTKARSTQFKVDTIFCSYPESTYLHDGNPLICNPSNTSSCPNGFRCLKNDRFSLNFCCGIDPFSTGTHPVTSTPSTSTAMYAEKPWVNAANGRLGSIPGLMLPTDENICTPFSRPFTFEGKPVLCIANDTASCPIGYMCTMHTPTVHFCCRMSPASEIDVRPTLTTGQPTKITTTPKPMIMDSICGASSKPYLYGGNPVMCLANETGNCPYGYTCDFHATSDSYFCCQKDLNISATLKVDFTPPAFAKVTEGCPPHMQPIRDHKGLVQLCDTLLTPETCPSEAVCVYSTQHGRHQCCALKQSLSTDTKPERKHASISEECPPGQIAYRDPVTNETTICAANHLDTCPRGHFCQWSDASGKFLCCGINAGCPGRSVAFVDPVHSEIQYCSYPSDASCPNGYTCQRSQNASYVCCSGGPTISMSPRLHPISIETPPPPVPIGQICPVGSPVPDSGKGQYQLCSEMQKCPAGYQCLPTVLGPVCCVKADKVCSLPAEAGANCVNTSTISPSSIPGQRFYYDILSESCTPFSYNGCIGNLNNFLSVVDCEQFCSAGVCPRGLAVKVQGKSQRCEISNANQCPLGYECTVPTFGSVAKTICCPHAELICNLTPLVGQACDPNSNSTVTRYYFHGPSRECRTLTYFGCEGNANNFESHDECRSFCSVQQIHTSTQSTTTFTIPEEITASANSTSPLGEFKCPVSGQTLHSDPAFRLCTPASVYPCPDGFTCQKAQKSQLDDVFVCCGPPNGFLRNQICPNGTEVYVKPIANQPTTCNPADAEACPNGYGCVLSRFMRTFYCCSTSAPHKALVVEPPPASAGHLLNTIDEIEADCPLGRRPALNPGTSKPLSCLRSTSVCPTNYVCILSNNKKTYLCCSKEKDYSEMGLPPRSLLPPNPFIQRALSIPRPAWMSKVHSGLGQWLPAAEESQWPQDGIPLEPIMTYGQVHVLNTETAQQPIALPLELFQPKRAADMGLDTIRSAKCGVSEKKQLGQECCAHEQCLYHCGHLNGRRICMCPRFKLLDMTKDPPRCSSTCNKWRSGSICLPENSEFFQQIALVEEQRKAMQRKRSTGRRVFSRSFNRRRFLRS